MSFIYQSTNVPPTSYRNFVQQRAKFGKYGRDFSLFAHFVSSNKAHSLEKMGRISPFGISKGSKEVKQGLIKSKEKKPSPWRREKPLKSEI